MAQVLISINYNYKIINQKLNYIMERDQQLTRDLKEYCKKIGVDVVGF
ncbi:unnamed protein product, partial [marine sediment metagenome]